MANKVFVASSFGTIETVRNIFVTGADGVTRPVVAGWTKMTTGQVFQFWPPEGEDPQIFKYYATWANSYGDGDINDSSHRDELNYQGESSYHGEESSLWGFDYAQMQTDLAGLEIESVGVRLTSRWTYAGGGKEFHIMPHNYSSKPSTVSLQDNMSHVFLGRGQTGSTDLPVWFGEGLRDGTQKGLGLRFTQPGEYAWGYCTGMYSTNRLVASPSDGDIIPCPASNLAMITVVAKP
jgi:hypothetical protein